MSPSSSSARVFRVLLCSLLLLFIPLGSFAPISASETEILTLNPTMTADELSTILKSEIAYVGSLQLSNGAIPDGKLTANSHAGQSLPEVDGIAASEYRSWPSSRMVPYFSDAAVLGVIRACKALGPEEAKQTDGQQIALAYLEWYMAHMNTKESDINHVAGTVYDYFIFRNAADGRIVEVRLHDAYASSYPTNNPYDYDSTDSYAAMFLTLMLEYAETFDSKYLKDKETVVDTLVSVIRATEVKSLSLTGAKPNYMVCYLMDNCEVFAGLTSAAEIYRKIGKKSKATDTAAFAEKVRSAIQSRLYSSSAKCWYSGVFDNGKPTANADLSVFYPQGSCQLFPVLFGVDDPTSERALNVYKRFKETYCRTDISGKNWSAVNLRDDTYPWAILLRAVVAMGDTETAETYVKAMNNRFIKTGHNYPYYNAEAGHLMTGVAAMLEVLNEKGSGADTSSADESSAASSEPVSESSAESSKEPADESSKETSKETSKENSKETSKETSKDTEPSAVSDQSETASEDEPVSEIPSEEPSEDASVSEAPSEEPSKDEPVSEAPSEEPSKAEPVSEPSGQGTTPSGSGPLPWILWGAGLTAVLGVGAFVIIRLLRKKPDGGKAA